MSDLSKTILLDDEDSFMIKYRMVDNFLMFQFLTGDGEIHSGVCYTNSLDEDDDIAVNYPVVWSKNRKPHQTTVDYCHPLRTLDETIEIFPENDWKKTFLVIFGWFGSYRRELKNGDGIIKIRVYENHEIMPEVPFTRPSTESLEDCSSITPSVPNVPDTPSVPDMPSVADTPSVPSVADTPTVPDTLLDISSVESPNPYTPCESPVPSKKIVQCQVCTCYHYDRKNE